VLFVKREIAGNNKKCGILVFIYASGRGFGIFVFVFSFGVVVFLSFVF
jgi:hypothetical protein